MTIIFDRNLTLNHNLTLTLTLNHNLSHSSVLILILIFLIGSIKFFEVDRNLFFNNLAGMNTQNFDHERLNVYQRSLDFIRFAEFTKKKANFKISAIDQLDRAST